MPSRLKNEAGKGGSFLIAAIRRAFAVIGDPGDCNVIVVAEKKHVKGIVDECSRLEARERSRLVIIPEPMAKNTAPSIACALLYINWASAGRDRNVMVQISDHIIGPIEKFVIDAKSAAAMAQADKLVLFGIRGETGRQKSTPSGQTNAPFERGRIETAEALTIPRDEKQSPKNKYEPEVFNVASFQEKPALEKPETKKSKHPAPAEKTYRHSGMFAFSSKFLINEFERIAPEVIIPFKKLMAPNQNAHHSKKGLRILDEWENLEKAYRNTKALSFDYSITEKCPSVVMVKAGFSWTDVGNWDEYSQLAKHTDAEVYGTEKAVETCFVDSDIPVALCGVEDLIVVARSGKDGGTPAVFISKKGETRQVKEIVEKIKAAGRAELL